MIARAGQAPLPLDEQIVDEVAVQLLVVAPITHRMWCNTQDSSRPCNCADATDADYAFAVEASAGETR